MFLVGEIVSQRVEDMPQSFRSYGVSGWDVVVDFRMYVEGRLDGERTFRCLAISFGLFLNVTEEEG